MDGRKGVHTVKADGLDDADGDDDDDDDILIFGVAVHALVGEICLFTTMIAVIIMVAVGGGGCRRASGCSRSLELEDEGESTSETNCTTNTIQNA